MSINTAENLYEEVSEEDEVKVKVFNLKGCTVSWHKAKVEPQGIADIEGKQIEIAGKKSPELAWVLAHELAHVLEPEEKKPQTTFDDVEDVFSLFSDLLEEDEDDEESEEIEYEEEAPVIYVDFQDALRRRDKIEEVMGDISQEEFQAARRSKRYLQLACGALGISLKKALLSEPAEGLKHHPDKGYFYQWRTQMDEKFKATNKREQKRAGAKARFERQKPLDEY